MKLPLHFQAVVRSKAGWGRIKPGGLFLFCNIGFYGIHNLLKIRSLKRSGMVQLLYFIGGKLRPREGQVIKVSRESMAGLG